MKKIAVLMSTYNGEKYLPQQLDSILSQKCDCKIDIIIRDDGSKDNTLQILENYKKDNKNIKVIKGKNIGCNASFFELLKNTDGYDYYAFSDQDDIWMKDKLQSAIDLLEKDYSNLPLLYGSCSKIVDDALKEMDITQKRERNITFFNTIIQNFLPGHSQVMNNLLRKEIISKNVDIAKLYYYDAWITNVAILKGKIIFDNTPHTLYRQHLNNVIGYGKGRLNWYKERVRRIREKQNKKYSEQIDYFISSYAEDLDVEKRDEIYKYQRSKSGLLKRARYIHGTKLYRQKVSETRLFKLMYLIGLY